MPAKKRTDKRWYCSKRHLATLKKVENLLNYCFSWRFHRPQVNTSPRVSVNLDNSEQIEIIPQQEFDNRIHQKLNALDFYMIWKWFKSNKYELDQFHGQKIVFANNPLYSKNENKITPHYICLEQSESVGWFYRVRALTYIKANDYRIACIRRR